MYIIGTLLEDNKIKAALCGEKYKLLSKKEADFDLSSAAQFFSELLSETGTCPADVKYIGAAVGEDMGTPEEIAKILSEKSGIKTVCGSIIGARALGEACLEGDVPSLVMLDINDTVESATVIDKKLYACGNFNHMAVDFGGFECACGRRGCFEACVSNSGIRRIATEGGVANAESITLDGLIADGSNEAKLAVERYIRYLASGITDIINLFQPCELVLDGVILKYESEIFKPMMDIVLREQYTASSPDKCRIRFARCGEDSTVIGAALLGG